MSATDSGMPSTVAEAQRAAIASGLDRVDAQMLLLHALGRDVHDRAWLVAHDADPMPDGAWQSLARHCARRMAGEPVAYLIGEKEFHGLALQVDARVLVPRPDTETLVEWALERLHDSGPAATPNRPAVLDLGTGSGAIALALKQARPDVQVDALDASQDALAVERGLEGKVEPGQRLDRGQARDQQGGLHAAVLAQRQFLGQDHVEGGQAVDLAPLDAPDRRVEHLQGARHAQADQAALDAVEGRGDTGGGAAHRWPPIPPASRSPTAW